MSDMRSWKKLLCHASLLESKRALKFSALRRPRSVRLASNSCLLAPGESVRYRFLGWGAV